VRSLRIAILVMLLPLVIGSRLRAADAPPSAQRMVRIREITTVEGARENSIIGYGLVVGLRGTGDQKQTIFTTQMLANILSRLGMQVTSTNVTVKNVAAVFVTGALPPFARAGTPLDVVVSSIGDAKSLEGGTLLLTPLRSEDGQVYALAQGPLAVGGYTAGSGGVSKQVNHPTVGRIANGAIAERDAAPSLLGVGSLSLRVADSINRELARPVARVTDSRRIEISCAGQDVPALLARIQALPVTVLAPTRVVVNEKTGTIVMGREARLSAVSILHGALSIEISTTFQVSQPSPFSKTGTTEVVPQTSLTAKDGAAKRIELSEGASVEQLVNGLQTIGASARDVVSILQALKAAGALQAELEVL